MCTQPLEIINPKLRNEHCRFNKYYDPLMLRVPCGKCQQCQNNKTQEWLVRLAYEYEYTKSIGGFVYKDMLTYNEWNVPRWHGLMCFNKEHYRTFMKKLRVYLERHYYKQIAKKENRISFEETETIKGGTEDEQYNFDAQNGKITTIYSDLDPRGKIKIFFVSEYGDETQRPHYHIVIFVQYKISPWVLSHLVRKSWIYGFNSNKPLKENIVNSISGISYVTKYLCKDINFAKVITDQKNSYFQGYLESQWQKLYNEPFDKENFKKYPCETIKKILKDLGMQEAIPYYRSSRYIGVNALQSLTQEEIEEGKMKTLEPRRDGQIYKIVNIPMYLKRKIYYDYDKISKAWELNDQGKLLKCLQEEKKIHKTVIKLEETFNQPEDRIVGSTEIGTKYTAGYEERIPIDKTKCAKIYNDLKRDTNKYALLINLLNYRDNYVTTDIIKKVEQGYKYQDFLREAILNDWENTKIFNSHKPHTWILEKYLQDQIGTWEKLITEATNDKRFNILLEAYDMIQTTRNINKDKWLQQKHAAWAAVKSQNKRT